jgi:hypothetical protein
MFTEAVAVFDAFRPFELVVSFYKQGKFINSESAIVSTTCDIFMWQFYLAYVYPQVYLVCYFFALSCCRCGQAGAALEILFASMIRASSGREEKCT